jgi:hypothetical protein
MEEESPSNTRLYPPRSGLSAIIANACATFTAASPSRATITPLLLVTVPSDRVIDVDARAPARRGTGTFDAAAVVQVVAKISAVPFLQPHTMDGAEDGCERSTKWYVVSGRRSSTRSGGAAAVWTKKMVGVGAEVSVRRREMEYKSVDGTRSHPIDTDTEEVEMHRSDALAVAAGTRIRRRRDSMAGSPSLWLSLCDAIARVQCGGGRG